MSKKELERVGTLARLQHGEINNREASEILALSIRQIKRLKRRYESLGATGLQHHSRGRKRGLHRSAAEVATILELLHAELEDWPPQHASEMLVAEGIKIERQSLRRLMIQHGLWQPRQRKKSQPRMWREPKHHYGELVQLDGSYHCWFDSQYTTLLAYIDDATGCIMALRFVQNEDLAGVVQLTKQYLKQHGRPLKVYTDRGKVFKVNAGQNRGLTQFERMLHDLNIKLKHAYSPQAKGRIERLFGTVQPRLARELELHGVTTLAAANKFLPGFIQRFNAQFAISPRKPANFHRPVDGFNLNLIFTRQTQRTLRQDFTISYRNCGNCKAAITCH